MTTFKEGDIVRLKAGACPQKVVKIHWTPSGKKQRLYTQYLHTDQLYTSNQGRNADDYVHVNPVLYEVGDMITNQTGSFQVVKTNMCSNGHQYVTVAKNKQRLGPYPSVQFTRTNNKETPMRLYQTKTTPPRFGLHIATNSVGHYVLEMKDKGGDVEVFPSDQIEEVVPYTISINNPTKGTGSTHVTSKPGLVAKGDLLINNTGTVFVVDDINTKNRSPQKPPAGLRKVVTESLVLSEDA